jgi:hypothetical protein
LPKKLDLYTQKIKCKEEKNEKANSYQLNSFKKLSLAFILSSIKEKNKN